MLYVVHLSQRMVGAVMTDDLMVGSDLGKQNPVGLSVEPTGSSVQLAVHTIEVHKVRLQFEAASWSNLAGRPWRMGFRKDFLVHHSMVDLMAAVDAAELAVVQKKALVSSLLIQSSGSHSRWTKLAVK